MILIEEKKAKQTVGTTSLFITFQYNPLIVDVIKGCDAAVYNKKGVYWEVPLLNLAYLLDSLVLVDDIELHLLKDRVVKHIPYVEPEDVEIKMFKHQKEAVEYGLNKDKWLLLDAPGLGKTLTIIRLAEERKKRDKIQHCLIICGINNLKHNWKKEIEKFSKEQCRIIGQKITRTGKSRTVGIKERVEELSNKLDEFFIILNIESLRDDRIVKSLTKGINKFDMIAFDEVHTAKNAGSQQGENMLKLTTAKYKIGATGTLLLNNPLDCYMPLKWIGMESSPQSRFERYYCRYDDMFGNMFTGYKNLDHLKDQIDSCSLRRTKDLLDLPEKNIINEYVEMDDKQKQFYENISNGIKDEVDKVKLNTTNLLAMVGRLRQATECPSILTTEKIDSAKMDRCVDLVDQILSDPNEKVVVFSVYKQPLNELFYRLEKHSPLLCTGDVDDSLISKSIDDFQTNNSQRVMLCTTQKMGTGVTLNRAHYAIFLSTPWTAGVLTQCEDRIHRIGTKEPVFIYRLWTKDTIDERVKELVESKQALSDYVIDDVVSDKYIDTLRRMIDL